MTKCPACGHKLTHLFYSSVCDKCDNLAGEVKLYYAVRGPLMVGPMYWSCVYLTREYAEQQCPPGGRVERVTLDTEWDMGQSYLVAPRSYLSELTRGATKVAWVA